MENPIPLLAIQEGRQVRDQGPGCPRGYTHLRPQPVKRAQAQVVMVLPDQSPGYPQRRTNIRPHPGRRARVQAAMDFRSP